jgi:DNA helicase II / ATP-dependent DNA helicase PcrA
MTWSEGIEPGTPPYRIAATRNDRLRVVAGPGTGKSFAMKRRVARLLEEGVVAAAILPVTFTRVAAEDLHRELVGMGVPGCDGLNGVTLHSLALRMLMRNHVLGATGRQPRTLNEFELEPLVCDLMASGRGKREVRKLKQAYEAAWARLQHEQPGYVVDPADAAFQRELLGWLRFHRAMLIGEVIPQLYEYLRSNPAAAERREFSHILVDEYQDLNRAEQGVLELISDAAEVCVVGDDDQSIYSFKYAHPDGIREWLDRNPGADDLGLVDCRRCPTRVVAMANSLIANNNIRPVPRALLPMPGNGQGDVRIIQYTSLADEVTGVADAIAGMVAGGTPPGDILVLAQRGVIGTPIYEALIERAVPVRSYYAEAELDAQEAQQAFALLKLFVDRQDRVALRWLIGLGSTTWQAAGYRRVRDHCELTGASPWDVLGQLSSGTLAMPYTAPIAAAFAHLAGYLEQLEALPDLAAVVDRLFPVDAPATRDIRLLALRALGTVLPGDRDGLIKELSQSIAQPDIPTEVADVRIMSLHKSKGLSAPVTIVSGCIEGLLPKRADPDLLAIEQEQEMEEQRRLFYVGITRVKADPVSGKPGTLVITYSQRMPLRDALGGGIEPASQRFGTATLLASRFIAELGSAAPQPIAG